MTHRPLILITNDDGIQSPGLHAVVQAVADLGELLIMAPSTQQTGAGRSYPSNIDDTIHPTQVPLNGTEHHPAFMAAVSPAQAARLAMLELTERPVDLCISGINFGENVGSGVTISGTVGAAIEAACSRIPALAVSLQTPQEYHLKHSNDIDFTTAGHFTRLFTQKVLNQGLPEHVDLLKIEIPDSATEQTPWRITRVSRHRYYQAIPKSERKEGDYPYGVNIKGQEIEPDSDIHALAIDKVISVSPMTIDLTAPTTIVAASKFYNSK